jgi:hypothetical protein
MISTREMASNVDKGGLINSIRLNKIENGTMKRIYS